MSLSVGGSLGLGRGLRMGSVALGQLMEIESRVKSRLLRPDQVAGLIVWLRANGITGLNNLDSVTTWSDESGQGNDATQATAAKKPTYRTNIQNGLPIVRFATDDSLGFGDLAALDFGVGGFSVIIAMQTSQNDKAVFVKDNWAATDNGVFIYTSGNNYNLGGTGVTPSVIGQSGSPFYVIAVSRDGAGAGQQRVRHSDGSTSQGADTRTLSNAKTANIGDAADGLRNIDADYAVILVYNRGLSFDTLGALMKMVGQDYGITVG